MALTVTVRQGGTAGAVDRDYSSEIQYWDSPSGQGAPTPRIRGGMQWDQGAAAQGEFYVTDDTAAVGGSAHKIGAHCRVFMVENASGCDVWLAAGRVDLVEWDPGDHPWGQGRQAHVTFSDANSDLKGIALTENWTRGAETDYARLVALQAYTLAGSTSTRPDITVGGTPVSTYRPSTDITVLDSHFAKNANTVTMPARTYAAGTEIIDIISDCATSAGKRFGVVIHHQTASGSAVTWDFATDNYDTTGTFRFTGDHIASGGGYCSTDLGGGSNILANPVQVAAGADVSWEADVIKRASDASYVRIRWQYVSSGVWVTAQDTSYSATITVGSGAPGASGTHLTDTWHSQAGTTNRVLVEYRKDSADIDHDNDVIHQGSTVNDCSSHLCLQYIVPTDTTTNVSACAISDTPAEIDENSPTAPVFAPIWDQGPSLIQDVSEAVGGIVSTYTSGTANAFTVSLDPGWTDVHDVYTIGVSDSQSVNSTQADARAAAVRASLRSERHTGQVTVKLQATQAHLLATGQLINIHSIRGEGGSAADRRIAQLIWEPIAPEVGTVPGWYFAHMRLDRMVAAVPDANGSSAAVGANTAANAAGTAQATVDNVINGTTVLSGYLRSTGGEKHTISAHGNTGATETFDLTNGNVHTATLDANCTFTLTGATNGVGCYLQLVLTQDATGGRTVTWPAAVHWPGGVAPTLGPAANNVDLVWLYTGDGGTNWYGEYGATSSVAALNDLTDVTITTATSGDLLRFNGSVWVNTTAEATGHYEILMASGSADPLLTSDGLDYLYVWIPG